MNAAVHAFRTAQPLPTHASAPLVREIEEAAPYPASALGPLGEAAQAVQQLTQAPMSIAAQSVLGAATLAVQGLRDAEQLHGRSPCSLFLMSVARSGERKTACDDLAMRGVDTVLCELRETYETELKDWRNEHVIWKVRRDAIVASAKGDQADAEAALKALGPEPPHPLLPQIITSSPTMGGIVKHLPILRPSLGLFADEGGQFLGGHALKAENKMETFTQLSSLWNGKPVDRWRAGDGVASFPGRRLAAHLMVQREVVEGLMADKLAHGQGFLARWLLVEPQSLIGARPYREPSRDAQTAVARFANRVAECLRRPQPLRDGTRNELAPPLLQLSAGARDILVQFHDEVEGQLGEGRPMADVAAFGAKAPEHAARIAAVLTLFADLDAEEVSGKVMADGITLATHYLGEAARLRGIAPIAADMQSAEILRRWLEYTWTENFVSVPDVSQRGPRSIRDADTARRLLKILENNGCVVRSPESVEIHGQRRREAYRINRSEGGSE